MTQVKSWILGLAALSLLGVDALAESFRVTAVFGRVDGPLAALVESPAGTFRVVRAGAEVGGGTVTEVVRLGIRLERDGQVTLVRLSGVATVEHSNGAPGGTTAVKMPRRQQAVADLTRAERTLGNDPDQARSAVASALHLPEGAIVTAVNDEPVRSPGQALREVYTALEREEIPSLTIEGVDDGFDRVYVIPADAGMSADPEQALEVAD
jgi:hypothetical protein